MQSSDAPPPRRRLRARDPGGIPTVVWGITVLHLAILVGWATLTLTYHAPDEPQHVDLVRVLAAGDDWPVHGSRWLSDDVVASLEAIGFHQAAEPDRLAGDVAPPRPERPAFADVDPPSLDPVYNQITQHPPLYHAVGAAVLWCLERVGADGWAFDRVVGALRLVSVVLVAPLPLLAHATARRLGAAPPVAVAAAVLPLAVPQLSHIGASVTNDALLILLCGASTVVLVRVVTGDLTVRTALAAGALAGAALFTKGLALVLLPWILLAYGLAAVRGRAPLLAVAARGAVALGVATLTGGLWWLRNLVVEGRLVPAGGGPTPVPPQDAALDVVRWARYATGKLVTTWWGEFGWLAAPLPRTVLVSAAVLAAAGAGAALVIGSRDGRWRRVDVAFLLVPVATLFAGIMAQSWADHVATGLLRALQGRYLYGGLVGAVVVVAFGYGAVLGGGRRWLPLATLGFAAGMQTAALVTVVVHYWPEPPSAEFATRVATGVRGALAWSPWPVGVPIVVVILGVLTTGSLAVVLARTSWADERT